MAALCRSMVDLWLSWLYPGNNPHFYYHWRSILIWEDKTDCVLQVMSILIQLDQIDVFTIYNKCLNYWKFKKVSNISLSARDLRLESFKIDWQIDLTHAFLLFSNLKFKNSTLPSENEKILWRLYFCPLAGTILFERQTDRQANRLIDRWTMRNILAT